MSDTSEKQLDELRLHQLKAADALKYVDEICRRNNIRYFLVAGSALGAVRHKGIIPWDDDIDIGLQMKDFDKFREAVKGQIPEPYRWQHMDVDPSFPRLSGNILMDDEPLITVFPIIKLSDNPLMAWSQWVIRKVISPIYQLKSGNRKKNPSLKKKFAYAVGSVIGIFFTARSALSILRWNERRYDDKDTVWSINMYSKYSMEKERIRNDWLKELIRVPFEDGEYPITKDYDAYLTHLYGDYMTPPPEKEREPDHMGDFQL